MDYIIVLGGFFVVMKYTYLLLHPSSNIIINHIFKVLMEKNILVKKVYRIINWSDILDDIYMNTYSKADTIKTHVHAHAYINKYMFGNFGLILILYKDVEYTELIKETLEVKYAIRSLKNKTKNGIISIFFNVEHAMYNAKETEKDIIRNLFPIQNKDSSQILNIFFSYVHCPDTAEQYEEDFKVLSRYMINELNQQEIDMIKKYCSYF